VLATSGSAALAADISYTEFINAPFEPGDSVGVELPWFDASLGDLIGVSFTWTLAPSAHVRVENTLAREATFEGVFEILLSVAAPWGTGVPPNAFGVPLGPVALGASDGVDWLGPDYTDFGRQVQERTFETSPMNPANFVGEGVFGCVVTVQSMALIADPGFVSLINEGYLVGSATVTYTYVPSPACTLVLLTGLVAHRRTRTP